MVCQNGLIFKEVGTYRKFGGNLTLNLVRPSFVHLADPVNMVGTGSNRHIMFFQNVNISGNYLDSTF